MANSGRGDFRRIFEGRTTLAGTERQLLDRFVAHRDDLAFEAIVARHGAMVLGVCRSILADPTDIDDAFQATFLVLVQKAAALRDPDHLGPWLHGVARRVALAARAQSRRRPPALLATELTTPDPTGPAAEHREIVALLHAEIDRLSLPERSAITLCDLEGLTHQEAADQLGWPLGTVKARVARGRDRLRGRLIRRGVALSASSFAALLTGESVASAVVARSLVVVTTRAALAVAAGRTVAVGLVSTSVLSLTPGVTRAMIFSKLQAGAVALGLVATATALVAPGVVATSQDPTTRPDAVPVPVPVPASLPAAPDVPAFEPVAPALIEANPAWLKVQIARSAVRLLEVASFEENKSFSVDQRVLLITWYGNLFDAELEVAATTPAAVRAVETLLTQVKKQATQRALAVAQGFAKPELMPAPSSKNESEWVSYWKEVDDWKKLIGGMQSRLDELRANEAVQSPPDTSKTATAPSPSAPPLRPADEARQRAILATLEERLVMPFANFAPFTDVLKYIEESTQNARIGLPDGIPIYLDPRVIGRDDKQAFRREVALEIEGVPLRTTLGLMLSQLGATYVVEDGLLQIRAPEGDDAARVLDDWRLGISDRPSDLVRNQAILAELEQPVAMTFSNPTSLHDLMTYIKKATIHEPEFPQGLPIYVDPVGLQDADKTMASPVAIHLSGVPLRTTLALVLDQLGLIFRVRSGVLVIIDPDAVPDALRGKVERRTLPTLPADLAREQAIRAKLETAVPMRYPGATPLVQVLDDLRKATIDPAAGLPDGLPIYLDGTIPVGKTRETEQLIYIDLTDIPLRTTLRLVLDQRDLFYRVEAGLIRIERKPKPAPPAPQTNGFR